MCSSDLSGCLTAKIRPTKPIVRPRGIEEEGPPCHLQPRSCLGAACSGSDRLFLYKEVLQVSVCLVVARGG